MERRVAELRRDFGEQGIAVEVLHGGEVAFDTLPRLDHEERRRFTLAQSGVYLLLEFPYRGWPLGLEERVRELIASGLTPILAHPERNTEVRADPSRLLEANRAGALVQITAASVDGRLGPRSQKAAQRLLELGLAHVLASDAHTPEVRQAGLASAVAAVEDERLARYLTEEAPAAIVAGEPVPDPPAWKRRGRRRRFIVF
jgi:protein-tyrosine phosphatase